MRITILILKKLFSGFSFQVEFVNLYLKYKFNIKTPNKWLLAMQDL